jgi:hypothetical protein
VEEVQNVFIKNILKHVKSMPMMKIELLITLEGFVKRKAPCLDKVIL